MPHHNVMATTNSWTVAHLENFSVPTLFGQGCERNWHQGTDEDKILSFHTQPQDLAPLGRLKMSKSAIIVLVQQFQLY